MTVKPVFDAKEWKEAIERPYLWGIVHVQAAPEQMAIANAVLPDSSPYKITQDMVDRLSEGIAFFDGDDLLAALQALLPPQI